MSALKVGIAACSLAATCFFAVPALAGVPSPPPSRVAPADAGQIPSGAIESGRDPSRLRSTPRGFCASRRGTRVPSARVTASGSRRGGCGPCEPRAVSTRCWTGSLLGKPRRPRLVSRRRLHRKRQPDRARLHGSGGHRSLRRSHSRSCGSPRPKSPASRPILVPGHTGGPGIYPLPRADPAPHQAARPDQEA